MNDALEYLMGGGEPTLSFLEKGTAHEGRIRKFEKVQQRDLATGQPKHYDNGDPMWQIVFTLETDERDPEVDDDDGVRRLFAKGRMVAAIREAVKRSGHKGDLVGGKLGVKYVKDGTATRSGFNAPKEFVAKFEPPVSEALDGWDEEPF